MELINIVDKLPKFGNGKRSQQAAEDISLSRIGIPARKGISLWFTQLQRKIEIEKLNYIIIYRMFTDIYIRIRKYSRTSL